MALPIAHAAAGYLVHRAARRIPGGGRPSSGGWQRAVVFMVVGNLPDMDFLVGFLIGRPGLLHRGGSHTVLAALIFGVTAGAFVHWRWRERFGPAVVAFGAAYASHLLLDYLTIDTRPPAGAQFFWPLSSAYFIAPVTIFIEIYIDGQTRAGFLRTVLAWPTVVVLAREIVIATVVVGTWQVVESWRARADPGWQLAFGRGKEDRARMPHHESAASVSSLASQGVLAPPSST